MQFNNLNDTFRDKVQAISSDNYPILLNSYKDIKCCSAAEVFRLLYKTNFLYYAIGKPQTVADLDSARTPHLSPRVVGGAFPRFFKKIKFHKKITNAGF